MDAERLERYFLHFLREYKPYKSHWNYEDGVVLEGMRKLYEVSGDRAYKDFVLDYIDKRVESDGNIQSFPDGFALDSFKCGTLLFFSFDRTGDEKYRRALDFLIRHLKIYPRCENGSFIHKSMYRRQIWLDGLYMAEPLYAEYETRFNKEKNYDDILLQFRNVKRYLYDPAKKLFYHGYDEARAQPWADKVTGCSPNFWSRAEGWWLMALVDTIEVSDPHFSELRKELEDLARLSIDGILQYRASNDGLIYQVIDRPEAPGNYTEASGSAMTACAVMKACRLGVLDPDIYLQSGRQMLESLTKNKLVSGEDGRDHFIDVCRVAGLGPGRERNGSLEYYFSEKRAIDEAKGVGPFMMAFAEYLLSEPAGSIK